jgi:tetratricopeptide (TPR) repeat protein
LIQETNVPEEFDERTQKKTVAAAWTVSLSALSKFPASSALMRLSAFLAPNPIPLELLEKSGKNLPETLATKLGNSSEDPMVLDEVFNPLLRYSLIRRNRETRSYVVHPLLQEVIREELSDEERATWAEQAIRAVSASFPSPKILENWPACDRLLPHALACNQLINSFGLDSSWASALLNQAGSYIYGLGEYEEAEPLYKRALEIREKTLGEEHTNTVGSLNNLAGLYYAQGRYSDAEALLHRALKILDRTKGAHHLETAVALNNLAGLYCAQRRYDDAEPLLERALAVRKEKLGPDHTDTANSLNSLGLLYSAKGRYSEAEQVLQLAINSYRTVLGPEHPDTGNSLGSLAELYYRQKQYEKAEPLYRNALAISEKALGAEHPHTVRVRNELIDVFHEQGKDMEAETLKKETGADGAIDGQP